MQAAMRLGGELERGQALFIAGDLVRARAVARRVFLRAKAAADVVSRGRARALIGYIAYDELRYPEARDALGLALRELTATLGNSDEVRLVQASLALVHTSLDQLDDARSALALAEADLEPPGPDLDLGRARLWITIAVARTQLEREPEAEVVLRAIIDELERRAPERWREVLATAQLHLGGVIDSRWAGSSYTGSREGAVQAYERCLELRRRAFGPENPRVAAAAFALARALVDRGELERAFALATAAMRTMVELRLERQARMSIGHATLGVIELFRGDLSGGTARLELACKIEESTFGAAHPATASMLTMLAEVHAVSQNFGKVKGLCARIVPVLRAARGHEASFAIAGELAAQAELALGGSIGAALSGLKSCLGVLVRRGFQDPHRLCPIYATLARLELLSNQREQALIAFERARALALDAHGAGSPQVRQLENELGLALSGARIALKGRA